jgi:cation diffusion facilitator CzcD-associated flavoprotein CzcO
MIDIKANPIVEIRPEGILTSDGMLHELDIIALATGFDSVTSGMKNIGLRNIYGEALSDTRKMGKWSYLGMTCNGYPNMFFLYGAQGPTAFSNGPSCVEVQGDWIVDAIKKVKDEDVKSINPTKAAEEAWQKNVKELSDKTLFPGTASWYIHGN